MSVALGVLLASLMIYIFFDQAVVLLVIVLSVGWILRDRGADIKSRLYTELMELLINRS